MIICIEGLTNSGKSSLCNRIQSDTNYCLVNNLLSHNEVTQRIKRITNPIENINKFDEETELLLYSTMLSVKAEKVKEIQGNVLLDRFSLSVYSYFTGRYNMNDTIVKNIVNFSARGIMPDITFFLDVSLDRIMERKKESPFSRKDIGIEDYYNNLRRKALEHISDFSNKSYIISCNNMTIDEIFSYVSSIII